MYDNHHSKGSIMEHNRENNKDSINKDKNNDESKKETRKLILMGIVLIIILAFLGYIIFHDDNSTEDDGDNSDSSESTTIIHTPPQSSIPKEEGNVESPTSTQNNDIQEDISKYGPGNGSMFSPSNPEDLNTPENSIDYTPEYLPTPEPVDNPIDNRKDVDIFGGNIHADNPAEAPTYLLVRTYAADMMNIDINENSGYRQSFENTIEKYGTENAKQYGFRPWWISGSDHTQEWNLLASQGGYRIENTFTINDESYIANDIIKYSITAMPRMHGNGGETRMQNVDMDIYLKYVDGKWLLDAYQFKNGYPQLR